VERALLDVAETFTPRQLERTVDEALGLRVTSRTKIRAVLDRAGAGRAGAPVLARVIDPGRPSSRTRSNPEEKLLQALRAAGMESPEANVKVHGWECDFHFVRAGVVLEVQTYQWHNSSFTFHKDHRKRKALERQGIEVVYVIDDDLENDLLATLAGLVQTITRRTIERGAARVA
jgi:very-short-patch-repair endonuclease